MLSELNEMANNKWTYFYNPEVGYNIAFDIKIEWQKLSKLPMLQCEFHK